MGTIASLAIKMTADIGGLKSGLSEAKSTLSDVAGKINQVGENMRQAGAGLTAGVTLPVLGVATAAVKLASDLNESANKIDVIFGGIFSSTRQAIKKAAVTRGGKSRLNRSVATCAGAVVAMTDAEPGNPALERASKSVQDVVEAADDPGWCREFEAERRRLAEALQPA